METRYECAGRSVPMPVQVANASAVSAMFLARAHAAACWLAGTGLTPVLVAPGRTLLSIAFLRYLEGDFGTYDEACVSLPVRAPGRAVGVFLRYLPVTDPFSERAGVELFGFPKWCADISIDARPGQPGYCRLATGGQNVFSLELTSRGDGRRSFEPLSVDAYSVRHGQLRRCRFTVAGQGVSFAPLGARLSLGTHPIAKELAMLQLSRYALCTSRIGRMRASFGEPEHVGDTT